LKSSPREAESSAAVAPTTGRKKVLIAIFHFPAFKADLYCAEFSVLHSKQRIFIFPTDRTFNHFLTSIKKPPSKFSYQYIVKTFLALSKFPLELNQAILRFCFDLMFS